MNRIRFNKALEMIAIIAALFFAAASRAQQFQVYPITNYTSTIVSNAVSTDLSTVYTWKSYPSGSTLALQPVMVWITQSNATGASGVTNGACTYTFTLCQDGTTNTPGTNQTFSITNNANGSNVVRTATFINPTNYYGSAGFYLSQRINNNSNSLTTVSIQVQTSF